MRIAITGTPGTGKTSIAELLENKYNVIHLNKLVKEKNYVLGTDEKRNTEIVDLEKIKDNLPKDALIESHFSHLCDAEEAIVLRCHPKELKKRLRDKSKEKIKENQEAEAIDKILIESIKFCETVNEIDTTNKSKKEVAETIDKIIKNELTKEPGQVDWSKWLMED